MNIYTNQYICHKGIYMITEFSTFSAAHYHMMDKNYRDKISLASVALLNISV